MTNYFRNWFFALLVCSILMLLNNVADATCATYASTVLGDEPSAYFQLNNTTSAIVDSSPNNVGGGSDGSDVTLGTSALTTGGISATSFNGETAYDPTMIATIPASIYLNPPKLTLEAWVKAGQNNLPQKFLNLVSYGRHSDGDTYGFSITPENGLMYTQRNVGAKAVYLYANTIVPGQVFHCVATFDGTTIKLYVNGQLVSSLIYPGIPAYNSLTESGEELQIGGWLNGNAPSFNGSVAQVAVYNIALTATQVLNHYVAGQLAPLVTEVPISADAVVDSIGINTHFTQYTTLYGTNYEQAKAALVGLGIRHILDGWFPQAAHPAQVAQFKDLGQSGIHGMFVTSLTANQAAITSFPSAIGPMFEGYTDPNEMDGVGDANWIVDCQTYTQNLYSWVKGNGATTGYPVIGPALVGGNSNALVGDLSAYMDKGNIHDYMYPRNPGTTGWGSQTPYGTYGSIGYNLVREQVTSGNKPIIATETGWGTNYPPGYEVDNYTLLHYIPRLYFEHINNGIFRTYTYMLLDDGWGGIYIYQTFGLVNHDFTIKPAYTAVQSLITTLSDPGPTFKTSPLTYQIVGSTSNVAHTLMQKRNGTYIIAIWIETPSWNVNGGGDIVVPPQNVTINTAGKFSKATISTFDTNGNLTAAPLTWSGTGGTFNVNDMVSFITLTK